MHCWRAGVTQLVMLGVHTKAFGPRERNAFDPKAIFVGLRRRIDRSTYLYMHTV